MRIKTALITLVLFLILTACHHADVDDKKVIPSVTDIVTATQSPVPTEAVTPSAMETPTLTPTEIIAPETSVTQAPTSINEPTGLLNPTDSLAPTNAEDMNNDTFCFLTYPTPMVGPYESFVVGKDINNNDLKMTQDEANRFIMSGNVLKLYDGSWFDLDDDGEPEYISIRPYGEWKTDSNGHEHYYVKIRGKEEEVYRYDYWRDEYLYAVEISGYGIWFMEDTFSDDYPWMNNGRSKYKEYCIYVTSLDRESKQVMIRTTLYGVSERIYSLPWVYRIEEKKLISCGLLGCEVSDFYLKEDNTYNASVVIANTALSRMIIKTSNRYDGKQIIATVESVDMSPYKEALTVAVSSMQLYDANGEKAFIAYEGDSLQLLSAEIVNPQVIETRINRGHIVSEYSQYEFRTVFDAYSVEEFEKVPLFKLCFRKTETGEIGYSEDTVGKLPECISDGGTYRYFEGFTKDP